MEASSATYIRKIFLHAFRNHEELRLDNLTPGGVAIVGANGAGKTNLLEAISLLGGGRGLRGAKVREMQNADCVPHDPARSWSVAAILATGYGEMRLGIGRDAATDRKIIRINGETVRAQAALGDHLACLWLTPRMDRLFIDSASARRRFFDRMVYHFDPGHAGRVQRYENALAQRSRLLREDSGAPAWLDSLEIQMAETGMAIAAARQSFIERLQRAIDMTPDADAAFFPISDLRISGALETWLADRPAVAAEETFLKALSAGRSADAASGGAGAGPHRSDLDVTYRQKDAPAAQCSTGEQKALLIGLILAQARLLRAERGTPPVLLLDEIAAHLDTARRQALFRILQDPGGQVFMTGTDAELFTDDWPGLEIYRMEHTH